MTETSLPVGARPQWLTFERAATEEQAREWFIARHGVEPEKVWRMGLWIYAGPVPERKEIKL